MKLLRAPADWFLISISLLLPLKTGAFINHIWRECRHSRAADVFLSPRGFSHRLPPSSHLQLLQGSLRVLSLVRPSWCSRLMTASPPARPRCSMGKRKAAGEEQYAGLVRCIQRKLQSSSDSKTKKAQEQYLKGTLHRGNKMPAIKLAVEDAMKELGEELEADDFERAGIELMQSKYSDDKQAGILVLQSSLKRRRKGVDVTEADVDEFLIKMAFLFESGAIADWSSSDNLSGKVLGLFVLSCKADVRRYAVKKLLAWSQLEDSSVWQRRAGHVSFVTHVSPKKSSKAVIGDELHYNGFVRDLVAACEAALKISSERFSNTGAGWVLRYCYHLEQQETVRCLERCAPIMTREGISYALEQCRDTKLKARMIELNKP